MTRLDIPDDDLQELVAQVREATAALIRGDVRRYLALVPAAHDYTLMPPTGGETKHGFDSSDMGIDALETFFAGEGDGDFELEQSYVSGDLAVLIGVERQRTVRSPACPTRTGRYA